MIQLQNISKLFADRVLFKDVTLTLQPGHRYGLIGPNGSGKSTLLKIMSGQEESSAGQFLIGADETLGFLKQDRFRSLEITALELTMMGDPTTYAALQAYQAILDEGNGDFDAQRFAELETTLHSRDGYALEARAGELLSGLGLSTQDQRKPLSQLSGGYRLRALLAQTLLEAPECLLLDEPTNHLDIYSIRWLEKFLQGYRGVVVVVSHDRRFLQNTCTDILDIDYQTVTHYPKPYHQALDMKVERREQWEKERERKEKEIAEKQAFVDRFKAKATKARQAQSRVKQLEKITVDDLPQSIHRTPHFKIPIRVETGKDLLRVEGISKSFGDKAVLKNVSFTARKGDRIAIVGANGIGKSTLLKILANKLGQDGGAFEWGANVQVGYFPQDHAELLSEPKASVLETVWAHDSKLEEPHIRGILGGALFTADDVFRMIEKLSGGEAARTILSILSIQQPNVLIIDEPTNHMDIETSDALAELIKTYQGSVILVSHDRTFLSRVATRVIEVRADSLLPYEGTWDEFTSSQADDRFDSNRGPGAQNRTTKASPKSQPNTSQKPKKRVNTFKVTKELETLVTEIERDEARLAELQAQFCQPDFYKTTNSNDIQSLEDEMKRLEERLPEMTDRWAELETLLEEA